MEGLLYATYAGGAGHEAISESIICIDLLPVDSSLVEFLFFRAIGFCSPFKASYLARLLELTQHPAG